MTSDVKLPISKRFRGFLPVVVDVETGGLNPHTDALLEIAAVLLEMDNQGYLHPAKTLCYPVKPFPNARLEPASMAIHEIDPYHPLRVAVSETDAIQAIFKEIRQGLKASGCQKAVLVGHNAFFDLAFVNAVVQRNDIKNNPFHPFSSFDTVTLAAVTYGQTVLARALQAAGLEWDSHEAHSARYDAERTADLFCLIVNRWLELGGWLG